MYRIISCLCLAVTLQLSASGQATGSSKTIEIRNNLTLADSLFSINLDSAYRYYHRAYVQATRLVEGVPRDTANRDKWSLLAEAANGKGFVLQYQGHVDSSFLYHRQCLEISEPLVIDSLTAYGLNNIGMAYHRLSELDSALFYYRRSLKVRTRMGAPGLIQRALNNIAWVHQQRGELDRAESMLLRVLRINEETDDLMSMGNTLHSLGANAYQRGDYAKAIDYHARSLKVREELDDRPGISTSTTELSIVYSALGDNQTAVQFLRRSIAMTEQRGGTGELAIQLGNLGLYLSYLNKRDSAEAAYLQSLALFEEIGEKDGIANSLNNYGVLLEQLGKDEKALANYTRSVGLRRETGNQGGLALSLWRLGAYQARQGQLLAAEETLREALALADQTGIRSTVMSVSQELAGVLYRLGEWKEAYEQLKLHITTRDSLRSPEANLAIIRQQVEYANRSKAVADSLAYALDLERAEVDKTAAELRADRNQRRAIALGSATLVLGLVGGGLWLNRKRLRTLLERNLARKEREAAEAQLMVLRARIDQHRLGNAMSSIQLRLRRGKAEEAAGLLMRYDRFLRSTLEQTAAATLSVAMEAETLHRYLDLEQGLRDGSFDYTVEIDESVDAEGTYVEPMLVQPFVENAVKHGVGAREEKGRITVRFRREGDCLVATVADNGPGLKTQPKAPDHLSWGTRITGERLAILRKLGGQAGTYEYLQVPEGTTVEVRIPLRERS